MPTGAILFEDFTFPEPIFRALLYFRLMQQGADRSRKDIWVNVFTRLCSVQLCAAAYTDLAQILAKPVKI
jgi:hypothetical protein